MSVRVEFLKKFATKKKGQKAKYQGILACSLIKLGVAKKIDK